MNYLNLYENFDVHQWVDTQEQFTNDSLKFQQIVDLIKQELGPDVSDIDHISQSRTSYGQSWYIIFKNSKEIRLSDHSVTSTNRTQSRNSLAMINIHLDFSEKYAKRLVDYYRRIKQSMGGNQVSVHKLFTDTTQKLQYVDEHSDKFIANLKQSNKTIIEIERSYMDMTTLKSKYPSAEHIFQQDIGGRASSFTFINQSNGDNNYAISIDYFDFLNKSGILS